MEEAKERLLGAIPYLRTAIKDANKEGAAELGILAKQKDGSGRIVCSFDCNEFFDDLCKVIGAPEQTEEDDWKAKAVKFVQEFKLRIES